MTGRDGTTRRETRGVARRAVAVVAMSALAAAAVGAAVSVSGGKAVAAARVERGEAVAQNPQLGVRFAGMGGAYAALVPYAPEGLVNPAALTALVERGITFSVGIPLETEGTSAMLAYGEPDRGVGGGLLSWAYNPILLYKSDPSEPDEHVVKSRFSYAFGRRIQFGAGALGAADRPSPPGPGTDDAPAGGLTPDTLAYGVELHYDQLESEPTAEKASVWGVGFGVMYQLDERLRLGLHVPNAYETEVEWSGSTPAESAPLAPVLGLAFQADEKTVLALDWAPETATVLGNVRGGVETWVRDDVGLRFGGELDQGDGVRVWTVGLSWRPEPRALSLDVAFRNTNELLVSTSYAF